MHVFFCACVLFVGVWEVGEKFSRQHELQLGPSSARHGPARSGPIRPGTTCPRPVNPSAHNTAIHKPVRADPSRSPLQPHQSLDAVTFWMSSYLESVVAAEPAPRWRIQRRSSLRRSVPGVCRSVNDGHVLSCRTRAHE